ncbi:hypothetical protein AB0H83_08260 [Dactylosporangium sp. NPDC050688]|uniref:hypothetical protein n=1 Tax=Dactylosporangium sp. NPDC050688 TaxID=3157217 RepID=UPI0033FBDF84
METVRRGAVVGVDQVLDPVQVTERDAGAEAAVHELLLRLAGHLPDRLMTELRDELADGQRRHVARQVAFETLSRPLQLEPEEIDLLRAELVGDEADAGLVAALPDLRGQRRPEAWLFVSALPDVPAKAEPVVRPLDLTGDPAGHPFPLDPVDRVLVRELAAAPQVTAVWRSWRMPSPSRTWHEPVRVVVLSLEQATDEGPGPAELARWARGVLAGAGDPGVQVEVCRAGLGAPLYQTLARSCGALLWAARPATPVRVAPAFDGVDPVRGPWFAPDRPTVADEQLQQRLLEALTSAEVIARSDSGMTDVIEPRRGAVVPLHLRTDGAWVWSEVTAYYLAAHGLAPDPDLARHLLDPDGTPPLDEVALHRVLVHLLDRSADQIAWTAPPPADERAGGGDA